jgi:metal-responsive CopG/Arc/MetJ family transcriptional regulator
METQLTLRLPRDLRQAIDKASARTGLKSAEIVRLALRSYLNVPAGTTRRPAERVRGVLGAVETGIPDLAERHRDYLLESLRRGR